MLTAGGRPSARGGRGAGARAGPPGPPGPPGAADARGAAWTTSARRLLPIPSLRFTGGRRAGARATFRS